ncbi:MAG: DUF2182 domain-containing protein [Clostridiales Family XIII bacterium]|jgi:predicted metal-binding membrane protein|nr:DUF2182 domain-containing protein [Clostridiales Family XIII bacterium]
MLAKYSKSQIVLFSLIAICTALSWVYMGVMDHGAPTDTPDSMAGHGSMDAGMAGHGGMDQGAPPFGMFVVMWAVMCVAMMLPTAIPMIMCLQRVSERRGDSGGLLSPPASFTAGYIVVWIVCGVAAWAVIYGGRMALGEALMSPGGPMTMLGILFAVAGVYQLSPLKYACLKGCRHPASFILHHWRPGLKGAYMMGSLHGFICVGCCIALMAVMTALGMMNLAWMAAFTLLMYVEKNVAQGMLIGKIAGWVLIAAGCTMIASVILS